MKLSETTIGMIADMLTTSKHATDADWDAFVRECKMWYGLEPDQIAGSEVMAGDTWFAEDYISVAQGRPARALPDDQWVSIP